MARLRADLPANVLLVIDAAYAEFVDRDDYDRRRAGRRAGNVVITRTFSKIYGLAGVRVGWGFCPPAVADVLNRLRGPFNVSPSARRRCRGARRCRLVERLGRPQRPLAALADRRLRRLGLAVPESAANFVLARFPDDPRKNADAVSPF